MTGRLHMTNVNHAIAIMKRVSDRSDRLNMACWQYNSGNFIIVDESFAHECGTIACFAGWVAMSPEFQEDGGWPHPSSGSPCIVVGGNDSLAISPEVRDTLRFNVIPLCEGDREREMASGNAAIAAWLDIPEGDAGILMATMELEDSERLYGVECTSQVKPAHVIRVLERLRGAGTIWGC
ncbi:hypothetical protein DU505_22050 [Billgrantia montanilacus]|uniref:Uncharacterized protein n=1 Tax=Billgrantia montanilacus TaxID=2282305 RepID=A0A368TNX8_9GAMM|nr:hypothetical protein DU505_22050 [Halomonas montanilacus]